MLTFLHEYVLISFRYMRKSRLALSYGNYMLNILRNSDYFILKRLHHFTFPPVKYGYSSFSTSSLTLVTVYNSYPHRCGMAALYNFDNVEHRFMWLLDTCISSLEKC